MCFAYSLSLLPGAFLWKCYRVPTVWTWVNGEPQPRLHELCMVSALRHTALSVLPLDMQRQRRRLSYGDHREQQWMRQTQREDRHTQSIDGYYTERMAGNVKHQVHSNRKNVFSIRPASAALSGFFNLWLIKSVFPFSVHLTLILLRAHSDVFGCVIAFYPTIQKPAIQLNCRLINNMND